MIRTLVVLVVTFATNAAFAAEPSCSSHAADVEGPEDNFRPPLEVKVIGTKELYFYSAPNARCKIKGAFAVPGNTLTMYKQHMRWSNVMLIAKNGNDIVAWVPSDRLKIAGQYGHNP
ncbi:hypothetical protein B9Z39_13645 [Limnohabitans sp. JirII-29]|uniref:hypothetical protein n=1 Tax=Limnohabitans sp. JirII-29 TaxID=1835756 RepID=UPI000D376137|nr:hypothetical protein [Limnohabitans sp. JirII-29]PUE24746.1 hypothetical protein B9Z39_13645 [Limnohabitans sp. JirII-29]